MTIHLFTIGFTQKSAEQFFALLRDHAVTTLVDTRLHPDSQLSGFAKARDLPYFLGHLCDAAYLPMPAMAPDDALLKGYRADKDWVAYEAGFNQLLNSRALIGQIDRAWWAAQRACLLCSEHEPDHCHRRLVAEYLRAHWPEVEIVHLV